MAANEAKCKANIIPNKDTEPQTIYLNLLQIRQGPLEADFQE